MSNRVTTEEVSEYYSKAHGIYRQAMDRFDHRSIHVGYFDDEHTSHDTAVENMTRVVADRVDVGPDDLVLHAGCGVGGPATWVARERGASVLGININEMQLEKARELADERGVADRAEFRYDDFTEMETVAEDSVDVVWGLEAVCYAGDKREFLEQARRVLRDGGRLVVADGFRTARDLDAGEERLMRKWLDGWKVPDLAHLDEFREGVEDLGFRDVAVEDARENVMPSSKALYYYSFWGYPVTKLLGLVGRRTDAEVEHVVARHYQHRAFRRELWTYAIVSATL